MAALSVRANLTEKIVESFVNNSTLTSSSANSAFPPNVILKKVPGSSKLSYRPNTELPAGIISLDIIFNPWFDLWNNDPI